MIKKYKENLIRFDLRGSKLSSDNRASETKVFIFYINL